jgi:ubiquitin carboxyl-terminal hydrolase L3
MAERDIRWLALESNPDVLNKYIQNLGVPTEKWTWTDVFGTDPDLLVIIPRPVAAVMLLFPITKTTEIADEEQIEKIKKEGQTLSNNVWFMKQTIGNACGTIGVLHALANNEHRLGLSEDSALAKFLKNTKTMEPADKANALVKADDIAEAHEESAKEGQTETPELDANINLHFVAFVERDGSLYELDGRKPYPINHGPSNPDTLLEDAVKIIDQFIKRDPNEVSFSMMALVADS